MLYEPTPGLEHNKINVGRIIHYYGQSSNYKSEYVAKELNMSLANYRKLENGKIELTDTRLVQVCKMYQITPCQFYLHFIID